MESDNTSSNKKPSFWADLYEKNKPKTRKEVIIFCLIIFIVVVGSAFAFNTYLNIAFKLQLLQTPCELCESFGNRCTQSISFGAIPNNIGYLSISNLTWTASLT